MKTCPLPLIECGEPRAMSEHPGGEGGGGGEGEEEGKGEEERKGKEEGKVEEEGKGRRGEGGGGGEGEEEGKGRGTKRGRWSQIRIPRYTQDGGQSYMCGNSRSCPLTMTPLATE